MKLDTRLLEIRDDGTHIPALAIRMVGANAVQAYYIHSRCGYPKDGSGIVLMHLDSQKATVDPYAWQALGFGGRTMGNAHDFIAKNFDQLNDGQVIDVRVILGEESEPVISDRFYNYETGKHDLPQGVA